MKKILSILITFAFLAPLIPVQNAQAAGEKRMLLVTAYYSPKPNQSVYIRGSYEADIRLNGRGTNGADGTEVYEGMLAAPKNYPFGTRVHIPGLGVGEVHDRGGAILARKNYDRIDVWMGEGEEGLARALNWGARLVEGAVYWDPNEAEPGLTYVHVNSDMPAKLKRQKVQNPKVFTKDISSTSKTTDVKKLQEALFSLGYYDGPVNGQYGPQTTEAVLMFQLNEGVIQHKNAAGAGNFGPKTRATLKRVLETYNASVTREIKRLQQNRTLLASGLGKSASGQEVKRLQQMLWELGYYRGDVNGVYDAATIDAVYEFQLDHKVIQDEWDAGAGYFGQKTHQALVSAINKKISLMVELPMEKQVWVPSKKDLPKIAQLKTDGVSKSCELVFDASKFAKESATSLPSLLNNLDLYDSGAEVTKLQQVLIHHGYLANGLDTGYFGQKTKSAILKFQMKHKIVSSASDTGAGRLGPKTRQTLNQL